MIAYTLANLVVWVGDAPPPELEYDTCYTDVAGNVTVGQVFNGAVFTAPIAGSPQANLSTLMQQADAALTTNLQTIADIDAWLTGAGAGTTTLTTAQISPVLRQVMREAKASAQQRNGVIRLLRGKLDGTT